MGDLCKNATKHCETLKMMSLSGSHRNRTKDQHSNPQMACYFCKALVNQPVVPLSYFSGLTESLQVSEHCVYVKTSNIVKDCTVGIKVNL